MNPSKLAVFGFPIAGPRTSCRQASGEAAVSEMAQQRGFGVTIVRPGQPQPWLQATGVQKHELNENLVLHSLVPGQAGFFAMFHLRQVLIV